MLSQKLQDDLMTAYQKVYEEKKGHAAGDSDTEKQASQLASDVRYKAKGKVPLGASDEEKKKIWDYIYEPSSKEILDRLLKRYIETQIYQAVIENNACEQAAKMIAMKNASENAEEIINDLQLLYNNARQASITQELSEIVGGAAAI